LTNHGHAQPIDEANGCAFHAHLAYPGFQTWWATRKHWYTDEFCMLIDRHIQTAKPTIYEGYDQA